MTCKECVYCYKGDDDRYPTCHYEGPHEWSPCEQEEENDRIARERREEEEFRRQIEEEYSDGYDDEEESNPWDAPGMSVRDFI